MLNERLKHHNLGQHLIVCSLSARVHLDIKPILVLMNGGNFKGYDKVIPKTNPKVINLVLNSTEKGKYGEIISYIEDEAKDFLKAYQVLKRELEPIKLHLK